MAGSAGPRTVAPCFTGATITSADGAEFAGLVKVATLAENGTGTAVTMVTDLTITGKPAQFGRGMIADVGGKIIGQFADCLAKSLAPQKGPAPQPDPMLPVAPPATEEIDLLDAASGAVTKRVVPALAALLALFLLIRRLRRRTAPPCSGDRMQ